MDPEKIKHALSFLMTDQCSVYAYRSYRRDDGSTGAVREMVGDKIPCRISFDNIKRVYQTDSVGHTMQTVRLFLYPDVQIDPGSVIYAYRNGKEYRYKNSGIPAVYETHQELLLEPIKTGA